MNSPSPRYRPCRAIEEGQRLAVVAPAGPVPEERLAPGLSLLEQHFELSVSDDLLRREGFLAGSDERRAEELNAAIRDPSIRAIWVARGGYGCSRIVDFLDADAFRQDPKPIVGFSDVTVLHAWVTSLGYRSVHGPVVTQLGELSEAEQRWAIDMITGAWQPTLLREGMGPSQGALEGMQGYLLGGCLALVTHLCGTEHAFEPDETLLFLEDVGERPYALDRYLTQLFRQEGQASMRRVRGVLLGDFANCDEEGEVPIFALETLQRRLSAEEIAWMSDLPVGHGSRNWALPMGARARIDSQGVHILDPAVER